MDTRKIDFELGQMDKNKNHIAFLIQYLIQFPETQSCL